MLTPYLTTGVRLRRSGKPQQGGVTDVANTDRDCCRSCGPAFRQPSISRCRCVRSALKPANPLIVRRTALNEVPWNGRHAVSQRTVYGTKAVCLRPVDALRTLCTLVLRLP